jgi:hypothetical protein
MRELFEVAELGVTACIYTTFDFKQPQIWWKIKKKSHFIVQIKFLGAVL